MDCVAHFLGKSWYGLMGPSDFPTTAILLCRRFLFIFAKLGLDLYLIILFNYDLIKLFNNDITIAIIMFAGLYRSKKNIQTNPKFHPTGFLQYSTLNSIE